MASRKKLIVFERLRKCALAFPESHEDHPWGETAIKVRGKVFVFLGADGLTVKLPRSFEFALDYPGTKPAAYGLGKSGWISSGFGARNAPPLDVLEHWIAESYSAVAPKKLSANSAGRSKAPKSGLRSRLPKL
ncbi:MAG: MmcQ/YjbR family DNA-binding protein [Alphaproteobacteria bacterium]|nr:MmcQ/YjbR family DNA-binding protein [Alphaproteobacteria bacterium]